MSEDTALTREAVLACLGQTVRELAHPLASSGHAFTADSTTTEHDSSVPARNEETSVQEFSFVAWFFFGGGGFTAPLAPLHYSPIHSSLPHNCSDALMTSRRVLTPHSRFRSLMHILWADSTTCRSTPTYLRCWPRLDHQTAMTGR